MAAKVCLGVAGADGEARGTAAEDIGHGGSLGFGLDPEKRAQGMGRERGGSCASMRSTRPPGQRGKRRPLAWHGARAMAHSEGEGREGETDSGDHCQKFKQIPNFCFPFLFSNFRDLQEALKPAYKIWKIHIGPI